MSKIRMGIREKVTLLSAVVCLLTMAALVAVIALSLESFIKAAMKDSLAERLDQVEALVSRGEYQRAVDTTGSDLLQLLDMDGNVLYSSPNGHDLSLVSVMDDDEDETEVDDLLFGREADDGEDSSEPPTEEGITATRGEVNDDVAKTNDESEEDLAETGAEVGVDPDPDLEVGDDLNYEPDDTDSGEDAAEMDSDDDPDPDDDPEEYNARWSGATPFLRAAFASQVRPADEPYVDASAALGTHGPYLVMRRRVSSPEGPLQLLAVASLAAAFAAVRTTAQTLAVVFCVVFALVILFVWYAVGLTLRPVKVMRDEVEAISSSALHKRVRVPRSDRDLAPLAMTFNALLDRIQQAIDEEKHFLSDASHELKSPLAASGLIIQTLAAQPGANTQALADLALENELAASIVRNLLVLARKDEGRMQPNMRPIDLADLLLEEVAQLSAYEGVSVNARGVMPLVVNADRDLLLCAIRNLLTNAVRYAASTVLVACGEDGHKVRIVVEDDGRGIDPQMREKAFERFARLDNGPVRGQEGTGLGLPVARSVVEAQGGTVRLESSHLGGVLAVIELPAS
ncbi:MAG: HAMP domain-containing sensor histidine kinase [Coriobacteriales bacterium]|nr:HAMP domain-containing sensor histidine kinase [Coriobacteriales bacterium]